MVNKILEAQLLEERRLLDEPEAKPIDSKWFAELVGKREAERVESEVAPTIDASPAVVEAHMLTWDTANQPPRLSELGSEYWDALNELARSYKASKQPSGKFKLPKYLNRLTPLQRYRQKWSAKEYGLAWKFQELPASEKAKFILADDPRYGEGQKFNLVLHRMPYYLGDWIEHQRELERSRAIAQRRRTEACARIKAQKAALDRAIARETNPGIPIVAVTESGFKVKSERNEEQ